MPLTGRVLTSSRGLILFVDNDKIKIWTMPIMTLILTIRIVHVRTVIITLKFRDDISEARMNIKKTMNSEKKHFIEYRLVHSTLNIR